MMCICLFIAPSCVFTSDRICPCPTCATVLRYYWVMPIQVDHSWNTYPSTVFFQQLNLNDLKGCHWPFVAKIITGYNNIFVRARKPTQNRNCQLLLINVNFHGVQHRAQVLHPVDIQWDPLSSPHFCGVKLSGCSQFITKYVTLESIIYAIQHFQTAFTLQTSFSISLDFQNPI